MLIAIEFYVAETFGVPAPERSTDAPIGSPAVISLTVNWYGAVVDPGPLGGITAVCAPHRRAVSGVNSTTQDLKVPTRHCFSPCGVVQSIA